MGRIILGDNLDAMRLIASDSVDLVCLDPPFNSGADYRLEPRTGGGVAFSDVWRWDAAAEVSMAVEIGSGSGAGRFLAAADILVGRGPALAYPVFMARRVQEMHRVLKSNGSLYLHCDDSASHQLRMLLDAVFGSSNFRNEIVWRRQSSHGDARGRFARVSDRILFYARSRSTVFRPVRQDLDPAYVAKAYRHVGADGRRYRLSDMSAPAGGGMAALNAATGRPNGWHVWNGYAPPDRGWRYSPETMERLHREGRIHCPEDRSKRPSLKRFLDENRGGVVGDVWDDVSSLTRVASEFEGYPTQKPLALLCRIVEASSDPGDLVLDPFCGSGTTLAACEGMGRRWIGMDASPEAVAIAGERLRRIGADVFIDSPLVEAA